VLLIKCQGVLSSISMLLILFFLAVLLFKAGQLKAALVQLQVPELKAGACSVLSSLADPSASTTKRGGE